MPRHAKAKIDWWGNLSFAAGLIVLMVGVTYGIQPHGHDNMGWTSPFVLGMVGSGVALLGLFVFIDSRIDEPMFQLSLFKIRAFTAGSLSTLLSAIGRGGLMFMLIIWLQGIWLPLHGFSASRTPLWAGIYMLPLTAGFLLAGPISGILSDRYGSRPFATGGMLIAAASFGLLELLPVNFSYPEFAAIVLMNGIGMGCFAAPNRAGVMNSLPPQHRGVGAGMNSTFQNAAQVLSIGIFFTLMIVGLSSTLSTSLLHGLEAQGVPVADATRVAHLPPISTLFAAFLGYSPMEHLLGPTVIAHLAPAKVHYLLSRSYFPHLISSAFLRGLRTAFDFAVIAMLIAAGASWLRGGKYIYTEPERHHPTTPGSANDADGHRPAPAEVFH